MHSGELARLAGVTVRTLRHYHHVGVLDEPPRGHNSYRRYDVHHLIRVLRIRRLSSLGIPLDRMTPLLDGAGHDDQLLDELDDELAAQIDRLSQQRDLIARLRLHRTSLDLPPELAPFLSLFADKLSPEMAQIDRDQSLLLAHAVGEEGLPRIVSFYERLSQPDLATNVIAVSQAFSHLGPHSSEQDADALVQNFVDVFAPMVNEFATSGPPMDEKSARIFAAYSDDLLNEQQRRVLERVDTRLNEAAGG